MIDSKFINMKIGKFALAVLFLCCVAALFFTNACTKNSNPQPIHDTVTVNHYDTTTLTDTVIQKIDTPDIKTGLVLYLPFNGTFADSSGSNNTVTAVNGASLGYDMHGYASSAFTSNGNGQYLMVSNNGAYALDTAFTISLDFMIRSAPTWNGTGVPGLMTLASIVTVADAYGPTFHMGMTVPGEPQYLDIGLNPSSNSCGNTGAGEPDNLNDTTSFAPQVGPWYNMIVTFSSGAMNVYINGKQISSRTAAFSSLLFCSNSNFVVGGWWSADPECINGEIDEVRLYNRSLNAQQIAWLSRNFQITSTNAQPTLATGRGRSIQPR